MSTDLPPQKRSRRIAMSPAELTDFLTHQRTCRVATIGPDGPHATPLWFWWDGAALWLYSLTHSRRWADLVADPRIGIVVDAGVEYLELCGVELSGRAEIVGETPRTGQPNDELTEVERHFAGKYFGLDELGYDGRHGWLKVTPTKIVSWDFRKIAS